METKNTTPSEQFSEFGQHSKSWNIFQDTKILKIPKRKSKKDRQHNGQRKRHKRTNNDLQNITHKTKDRINRTPLRKGKQFLFHQWHPSWILNSLICLYTINYRNMVCQTYLHPIYLLLFVIFFDVVIKKKPVDKKHY